MSGENAALRNHEYAGELKAAADENAALRGNLARLCRAVQCRMASEDPTPEERMELRLAWSEAVALIEKLNGDIK